ncbi:hydroxymethylglutaryl-CoA lyase [Elioraea sp.]|uniref:hydroxymethylglutaryl-CoA lyase n=1 Tax=Elioraea sp. TaxID=2185103 RepID=UPI0021DD824B|nr:hydroxymethylglutaryl-CoA lyase [Elioraea sp.]GIX09599.1 MAG: hydroxymethylglutaryl-CoA lyase [Elioraea sp.]
MHRDITICEVGPRDGLQNARSTMATADKHRWITALAAAGLPEIEVGSFVRPDLVPQLADTAEVVAEARKLAGIVVVALVPNARGAERAIAAGAHKLTVPVSASRAHSLANVRMEPLQAVEQVRRIVALAREAPARPAVEVGISTAFGCSMQGAVPEDDVVRLAEALAEAGVEDICLSDTVGMANPAQVKRLIARTRAAIGDKLGALHLHDTRGRALANALAGYEAGIRAFDGALAGLGGCPFAPGASGNAVTEDLVWMFEEMGLRTGVDLDGLLAARAILAEALPGETLHGHLHQVKRAA